MPPIDQAESAFRQQAASLISALAAENPELVKTFSETFGEDTASALQHLESSAKASDELPPALARTGGLRAGQKQLTEDEFKAMKQAAIEDLKSLSDEAKVELGSKLLAYAGVNIGPLVEALEQLVNTSYER